MGTQTITNEDLMTVMRDIAHTTNLQLTHLQRVTQELTDKHSAYINDIADILDRVSGLEKQMPHITQEELYELHQMLQKLVDWAIKAAKTVKVPLDLP